MNIKLQKNIGCYDRLIRLTIAIGLLVAAYWYWSLLLLVMALFTFFETFMSWCLFYQLLGKSSCPIDLKK